MAECCQPAVADMMEMPKVHNGATMDLGFLVPGSMTKMTMSMVVVPRVFGTSQQMLPLGAGTDTTRRQTGIPQWSRMGFGAVAHMKEMTSV